MDRMDRFGERSRDKLSINVDNIYFSYDKAAVLNGISFQVSQGEFVGIIGPNGTGKSTLLKNLNRILRPDSGKIEIEDRPIESYSGKELAQRVALVPQDTGVDFAFTVEEIVLMGRSPYLGRFQSESELDRRVAFDSMRATNTLHLSDRLIGELSGGERQRVFIAKALAQQPRILLLDEPTSHLDINHQMEVFNLLSELSKNQGITVVAVLHDLNLASQYCDRLLLISEGRIYKAGSPAEVLTGESISNVYGVDVQVDINPLTGRPFVLLCPRPAERTKGGRDESFRIKAHIICGGGSAHEICSLLASAGCSLSMGVVNAGDADLSAAGLYGIRAVVEEPFSAISEEAHMKNMEMIKEADLVLLTEFPFGNGNIRNLTAALEACRHGKPVVMINPARRGEGRRRDYTGGVAMKIYEEIKESGGVEVASAEEALGYIKGLKPHRAESV